MTKLIAEIGWNHMGNMVLAKDMITAAKESGADFAKFQTFDIKRLKSGPWDTDGRREIYEKAQLSLDNHFDLKNYCDEVGIGFMSSVFSIGDADLLKQVVTDYVKIPSMESRNRELIHYCLKHFKHLIISTGTSTYDEIRSIVVNIPKDRYTLLHCVSSYPCKFDVVNLPRINNLKDLSDSVGFSDHTQGIETSVLSLGYDIKWIEKHFTTNNDLPGRDNEFAVLPKELKRLSEYIKISEEVMNYKGCDYQKCETDSREIYGGRWNG
jgi:N,N'-diacetyllegionaminate synthase|tara:strand:- start:536 stop:1336 length:801 start_codon:yes stop_codon:yes gene_type:complete